MSALRLTVANLNLLLSFTEQTCCCIFIQIRRRHITGSWLSYMDEPIRSISALTVPFGVLILLGHPGIGDESKIANAPFCNVYVNNYKRTVNSTYISYYIIEIYIFTGYLLTFIHLNCHIKHFN